MPFRKIFRDDAILITLLELFEDEFTVYSWGIGARARFEMMGDTAGGRECAFAEWTGYVCALMGARVEMLRSRFSP